MCITFYVNGHGTIFIHGCTRRFVRTSLFARQSIIPEPLSNRWLQKNVARTGMGPKQYLDRLPDNPLK